MSAPASRSSKARLDLDQQKTTPTVDFVPSASSDFVLTPYVADITDRALAYLEIGYAVHLSGPAGTGKTTLALHIAARLGRSCTLLHGDDEFRGSDLIGRDAGYRRTSVRDNYVSSIVKTEETLSVVWASNRLTTACQNGHTLIYDEFTRSPATANNPFLSVLEEGILNIPSSGEDKGYIKVHPNFRAIFTSNPEEYVGVHKTQDALLDRMITMELDHPDRETETSIVLAKSNRSTKEAEVIVDIIRAIRQRCGSRNGPTVRAAIAIAQIMDHRGCTMASADEKFRVTCQDVLYFNASRQSEPKLSRQEIDRIVQDTCAASAHPTAIAESSAGSVKAHAAVASGISDASSSHAKTNETDHPIAAGERPRQVGSGDEHAAVPTEQDSLESTLNSLETLSAAVVHISQPTRILPRPPMLESTDAANRDRSLSVQ
jgi:gas vesicle protein GvpN